MSLLLVNANVFPHNVIIIEPFTIQFRHVKNHILFSGFLQLFTIQNSFVFTKNCASEDFLGLFDQLWEGCLAQSAASTPTHHVIPCSHSVCIACKKQCLFLRVFSGPVAYTAANGALADIFSENTRSVVGTTCCSWIWAAWWRQLVCLLSWLQLNLRLFHHLLQGHGPIGAAWLSVVYGLLW